MKREIWVGGAGLIAGLAAGWSAAFHGGPIVRPLLETRTNIVAENRAMPVRGATPPSARAAPKTQAADPQSWLRAWLHAGAPRDEADEARAQLGRWSALDPNAALAFVANAPRFPQRNRALAKPLAVICAKSPAVAIAWLTENLPEEQRGEVARTVIADLVPTAPAAALQLAEAPDTPVPSYQFGKIFAQLAETNSGEALAGFLRLSEDGRKQTVDDLVRGWAKTDLNGALGWCRDQADKPYATPALDGLLAAILSQAPDRLDAAVHEFPALQKRLQESPYIALQGGVESRLAALPYLRAEHRAHAVSSLLEEELPADPDHALSIARDLLPADEAATAIASAWRDWMRSDRKAATAWLEQQPDPAVQREIEMFRLRQTAAREPAKFLNECSAAHAGPAGRRLVDLAVSELSERDPQAAAQWLRAHPEAIRPDNSAIVACSLAEKDETAAATWTASLPTGDAQDQALGALCQNWLQRGETELATTAIDSMSNPERQTSARIRAFWILAESDPKRATAWMEKQPFDPAVRATWLALLHQRGFLDQP